jgi:predicted nucleic acid-binding protein
MDLCCLNRPFDDQSQDKVRLETEAIISILGRCLSGAWLLIGSDVIELELRKNTSVDKKQKVTQLHNIARARVVYNAAIKTRAAEFRNYGIKLFDSLHLASAEYACADVFLTVDARLIKSAARSDVKIRAKNPLDYYMEVLNDEQPGN